MGRCFRLRVSEDESSGEEEGYPGEDGTTVTPRIGSHTGKLGEDLPLIWRQDDDLVFRQTGFV